MVRSQIQKEATCMPARPQGQARTHLLVMLLVAIALTATAWVVAASNAPPSQPKVVLARYVERVPKIDGIASEPEWAQAVPLVAERFMMKALYTNDTVTILASYDDPSMRTNTSGAWSMVGGQWKRQKEIVAWESFRGKRHPEWFAIMWNISMPAHSGQARLRCQVLRGPGLAGRR